MSASIGSDTRAEPNLTPILDMVFQLITFFMLVINFKAADVDRDLQLPIVGSAQPVETTGQEDLLVLNINKRGQLIVQGSERPDVETYVKIEAQAARLASRKKNKVIKPGDELPTTIVVRADRQTPFRLLYHVVRICQEQGYRKFSYLALDKDPGRKEG